MIYSFYKHDCLMKLNTNSSAYYRSVWNPIDRWQRLCFPSLYLHTAITSCQVSMAKVIGLHVYDNACANYRRADCFSMQLQKRYI